MIKQQIWLYVVTRRYSGRSQPLEWEFNHVLRCDQIPTLARAFCCGATFICFRCVQFKFSGQNGKDLCRFFHLHFYISAGCFLLFS